MKTIAIILFRSQNVMSQLLELKEQPELKTNLAERLPGKEGHSLSSRNHSWEEIRGLSWVFFEDD